MTKAHTEVVVDSLPDCDFCRREDRTTAANYDGRTTYGPWAYMCQECFEQFGIGLGLGKGQKLLLQ